MTTRSSQHLENFTHRFAKWAGSARGFIVALLSIIIWFIAGGMYGFSNNWANAMSIYIGVITFLMVFLIQRAQNKGLDALHLKINEIIAATQNADNRMINAEELTEKEISEVQETHRELTGNGNP